MINKLYNQVFISLYHATQYYERLPMTQTQS